jgi:hypothetical protein
LPVTLSASGLGGSFRALVFHVDGGLDASPIATNGALGSFEWFEGGAGPSPLELEVVLSTPRTRVQLVRAGGAESNRVRVDGLGEVFAEPPEVPDLVPWFAGPTPRVLIVGRRFDSGRLVDVDGAAPPEGSYRCRRVTIESLQECAMECEVFRRQPLMTNGYVGFGSARSSTRRQAWC